jgi:hypothetical protein
MPLQRSFCIGIVLCASLTMVFGPRTASAQGGGFGPHGETYFELKQPVADRVYQRDRNGRADIVIEGKTSSEAAKQGYEVVAAKVSPISVAGQERSAPLEGITFQDGRLLGVPTGGPYRIDLTFKNGGVLGGAAGPFFVGDLWVLAGQSNMEGVGDLLDVTPPHPLVMSLGMDGKWARAKEPLHWLVDSPDSVHSGNADDRERRAEQTHRTRTKGAGLGLSFGVALVEATNVPIGLIPCAHGGTRMDQWDPALKEDGGRSLYGSMLREIKLAGGKVKGVLWYQGESDADTERAAAYPQVFGDFIAAARSDLGQPDLPFYLVQIGRVVRGGDPKPWNAVQDAQRLVPDRVFNTAVVSVIDLELDDLIHVGTQGLKRAGRRLARVAAHDLFGQSGGYTPTLDRVSRGPNNSLVVKFKGVNAPASQAPRDSYGLRPLRHIAGFSIRNEDGSEIPLIYEAHVGESKDNVVLKLTGKVPEGSRLYYGWGFDPYCNLTDSLDMAVPVFGPVKLDDVK